MEFGKFLHKTKYDLSSFLNAGQMVRIKDMLAICTHVSDSEITLDKFWNSEDSDEVLYVLPSYKGETGRRYYKYLYKFGDYLINNPIVQTYAKFHYYLMTRIATYGATEALSFKKKKKMKTYARWVKFTELYKKRAMFGNNLIKIDGIQIDLSQQLSPEQMAAEREKKELEARLEKEKLKAEAALNKLKAQEAKKSAKAEKEAQKVAYMLLFICLYVLLFCLFLFFPHFFFSLIQLFLIFICVLFIYRGLNSRLKNRKRNHLRKFRK